MDYPLFCVLMPDPYTHGLAFRDRGAGNVELLEYKGLLVKASYWRWPDRDMAGNAIDFYTKVLKVSFHDAMRELLSQSGTP
ncbi:MAG: hypothetical protein H7831_16275 [Magnetococcus sp. WYHC-3]